MLEVKNLSKKYGANTVLAISQQKFNSGVIWIKGSNGSGKSTLLKILAGLIDFKGIVIFNEKVNLRKHPITYRKLVNFAESEPLFPPFFTGWDMINLFIKAKNGSLQALSPLLNDFNMDGYLNYEIESYSAGMLKKLSLVMAFTGTPELILLDEPFITLDNDAIDKLASWITKTTAAGTNFIITSHQSIPSIVPTSSIVILRDRKIEIETAQCL
ncbi:ATP-binding cassette domain-containing protein [Olivibacter sp. SDN3]|uniref:ABC transporter ATP-binding protein n=1 Tax=Olivibacter sp. SDN3 TaxID=2764720 RepID=UPI001650E8BE|nr:ATP-binding cassette domain-containing protein [Olivibacter sp. SDN3]QNL51792.1 ATP-binding cassette domain-containing protein [Olivibacter sp. SDN3]